MPLARPALAGTLASLTHQPQVFSPAVSPLLTRLPFPQALLDQLRNREAVPVRITGPLGNDIGERGWEEYDALVLIVGGVGVSGWLPLLAAGY